MKNKKIAASVLALSLIASAATANGGFISNLIPVKSVTASAAIRATSADGKWTYDKNSDNTVSLVKYHGSESRVFIPEAIKDAKTNQSYAVTQLEVMAFYDNNTVTSVSVCRGITEIKNRTFANAKNLKNVDLPHGITKIGYEAFCGTNIQSISLPSTIETIENDAFRDCPLTSLTLQNGIKEIGNNAFANTKISSIVFPSTLTTIGNSAFENTKIDSLNIPSSLKKIGSNAFNNCFNLSYVNFENISDDCEIGASLFKGCDKITNVYMTYSSFKIAAENGALGGCKNLAKINNTTILKYDNDGKPYFTSRYAAELNDYYEVNTAEHVAFMDQYLDAMIKYTVRTETADCTTDAEKIRALHDWVCNKVDYAYDLIGNTRVDREEAFNASVFFRDTTICEGYARALTALLREAGLEAYPVSTNGTKYNTERHMWTMVKLNDHYFHLDACHDDCNGRLDHYLKSDIDIKKCNTGHGAWIFHTGACSSLNIDMPAKTPECEYSLGDANMDHVVDEKDSVYISNIVLGNVEVKDMTLTDVTGDGIIDTLDVINVNYLII